ncbi:MAG TPA: bifunctional glutamate N-acetyltransferase/amino-acid acetyltransferase ArgJ [Trueperaceae bacterium]|nr:bifunctional glutamate N-acetyltransferase/amino-acid acetyltransferase ArgJ [Trueperaceae bacterium]
MRAPQGFEVSGVTAGIKESGRSDLGLVYSPFPLVWALSSTTNLVKAPCVARNRARYAAGTPVRALVVNSGNANCANGEKGTWDNEDLAGSAAGVLGLERVQDVLTASTGVIGQRLPLAQLTAAMPVAAQTLADDSSPFAQAILTTDTVSKEVAATLSGGARVVGVAKGSGMIHPNMATLLCFVMTDARVTQESLRELWPRVVDASFNQLTVDGDTSTNDMAIVLSSRKVDADEVELEAALTDVCIRLAKKVARDGEGATKLITVRVTGGRSLVEARQAARTVAGSNLIKSAVHGADPNWGRILAALGRSGAVSDLANVRVAMQGVELYRGSPRDFDPAAVSALLSQEEVLIEADLAAGNFSGEAWGCDLSPEYVRINADYTT